MATVGVAARVNARAGGRAASAAAARAPCAGLRRGGAAIDAPPPGSGSECSGTRSWHNNPGSSSAFWDDPPARMTDSRRELSSVTSPHSPGSLALGRRAQTTSPVRRVTVLPPSGSTRSPLAATRLRMRDMRTVFVWHIVSPPTHLHCAAHCVPSRVAIDGGRGEDGEVQFRGEEEGSRPTRARCVRSRDSIRSHPTHDAGGANRKARRTFGQTSYGLAYPALDRRFPQSDAWYRVLHTGHCRARFTFPRRSAPPQT